jgi:hypothetical protein
MNFEGKRIEYGELTIKLVNGQWMLAKEFVVLVGTSHKFVCPEGMPFDGLTIPRFFWRLIGHPYEAPQVVGAVPHDGGCTGELVWYVKNAKDEWVEFDYTRAEIDEAFREIEKLLKVKRWRVNMMYRGVRLLVRVKSLFNRK